MRNTQSKELSLILTLQSLKYSTNETLLHNLIESRWSIMQNKIFP